MIEASVFLIFGAAIAASVVAAAAAAAMPILMIASPFYACEKIA